MNINIYIYIYIIYTIADPCAREKSREGRGARGDAMLVVRSQWGIRG